MPVVSKDLHMSFFLALEHGMWELRMVSEELLSIPFMLRAVVLWQGFPLQAHTPRRFWLSHGVGMQCHKLTISFSCSN